MSRTNSLFLRGLFLALALGLCPAHLAHADATEKTVDALFEASGVRGGLIVDLDCGEGRLTPSLRPHERFLVQGLARNAEDLEKARVRIDSKGLYGPVSVRLWTRNDLPYGGQMVNLLVAREGCRVPQEEIRRVLAPRGAVVTLDAQGKVKDAFLKPVPEEIDDWTHYLHDAGNNAVAEDERVGPPKHLQWKAGPMWSRSHEFHSSVQALVSAEGRLIGVIDEGIIGQPRGVPELWTLMAKDAFNGKLLWRRPCDMIHPQALTAIGDTVYVTLEKEGPLCILDAATGDLRLRCPALGRVNEIAFCEDHLILSSKMEDEKGKLQGTVLAADPEDGQLLWKHPANGLVVNTLVAGEGSVCYCTRQNLVCLSLGDGQERWRTPDGHKGRGYAVLYKGVVFLTGGRTRAFSLEDGKQLWTGPDGSPHARNPPGLFGADGLIWCAWAHVDPRSFLWQHREETREGYDPWTGEVKRTVSVARLVTAGHHIRCYPPKATSRYLLLNKRGVEFFDLRDTGHMRANWTRAACGFGVIPANGFLYATPSQCFCYQGVLLHGFNALTSSREKTVTDSSTQNPSRRLTKGPAYEVSLAARETSPTEGMHGKDWPTYRHDAQRSGCIDAALPVNLIQLWETSLCNTAFAPDEATVDANETPKLRERPMAELTPPVAAGGQVFVAEPNAHKVHCLSEKDGKLVWTFTANARVDSPPTLYRGLCLFGCADGCVYCVTSSDGQLAWRFQAAPEERLLCVMEQLESAWPVHGSLLLKDGKIYLTAGRSSYLDGGIRLYALDPFSGEILHQNILHSEAPDVTLDGGRPFDMEGARSDILVSGKKDIYLYQYRFDATLTPQLMPKVTKLGDRMGEAHLMTNDGFLDKTWFNRTYWMFDERWPGYYFVYRGPKSGQIVVFDEKNTYTVKVYTERYGHSPEFKVGTGYQLIADRNTTKPVLDEMDIGAEKGRGFTRTELPVWSQKVPIRGHGLLLSGKRLYLAGPPDLPPETESYWSILGKRGALFRIIDTQDGSTLADFKIDEVPVFDGLIAARNRLYMSTMQGTLICWGGTS